MQDRIEWMSIEQRRMKNESYYFMLCHISGPFFALLLQYLLTHEETPLVENRKLFTLPQPNHTFHPTCHYSTPRSLLPVSSPNCACNKTSILRVLHRVSLFCCNSDHYLIPFRVIHECVLMRSLS